MKRPVTFDQALNKLAALCARSEQCTDDIMKKLARMEMPSGEAMKVLNKLKELKFVDDDRFARAFTHDKVVYQSWGFHKISQALWAKRIPTESIENAREEIEPITYRKVAVKVVAAKIKMLGREAFTPSGKQKVIRYAVGRGFEPGLVIKILNHIVSRYSSTHHTHDNEVD